MVAGAVLFAGCGAGGDGGTTAAQRPAEEVVAVAADYYGAFSDQDGRAACSHMTGEAMRGFVVDFAALGEGLDCAATLEAVIDLYGPDDHALLDKALAGLSPDDVNVEGARATVSLPKGKALRLRQIDGAWYVSDTDTTGG